MLDTNVGCAHASALVKAWAPGASKSLQTHPTVAPIDGSLCGTQRTSRLLLLPGGRHQRLYGSWRAYAALASTSISFSAPLVPADEVDRLPPAPAADAARALERSQELEVEEREIRRSERAPRPLVRVPDAGEPLDPHRVSIKATLEVASLSYFTLVSARSSAFITLMNCLRSPRPRSLTSGSRIWPAPFSGSTASTRVRPSSS